MQEQTYIPTNILVECQWPKNGICSVETRNLYTGDKILSWNLGMGIKEIEDSFIHEIAVGEMVEIHFDNKDYITVPQSQLFYVSIPESDNPILICASELEKYGHILDPEVGQRTISGINKLDLGPILYYIIKTPKNKNHFQVSKHGSNILLGQ